MPEAAPPGGRGERRRHPWRRRILLLVLLVLIPVGWSYGRALTAPGSAPLTARTVEWVSAHGGRPLVLWAERTWYSRHTPPVGGTPVGGIPTAAAPTPSSPSRPRNSAQPHQIAHLARPG